MMFLSRNTILTAVLLATTAAVETQAQEPDATCAGEGTVCTYNKACRVASCQYNCNALGLGAAPGSDKWEAQKAQEGVYNPGKIVVLSNSKANNETDVDDVDVVAVPKDAMEGTEDESTSGGSPAGVASYVLFAVGGAAIIAGL